MFLRIFFSFVLVGALEIKEGNVQDIFSEQSPTMRTGLEMFFGNETSEFLGEAYRKKIFRFVRHDSDASYFQENLIKEEDFKMLIDELMTTNGLLAKTFVKLKKEQKDLGETEELVDARTAEEVLALHESKVITLNALLAEDEDEDGDNENHPRIREPTKDLRDVTGAPGMKLKDEDGDYATLGRIRELAKDLRDVTGVPHVGMNLYLSQGDSNVLPPHTDMYDVFVAQIYGWKKWTTCVSKTPVYFNEAIRAELYESQRGLANGCTNYEESNLKGDDGMHCEDFLMGPGDVLYMPKGVRISPSLLCKNDGKFSSTTINITHTHTTGNPCSTYKHVRHSTHHHFDSDEQVHARIYFRNNDLEVRIRRGFEVCMCNCGINGEHDQRYTREPERHYVEISDHRLWRDLTSS
jgi:hypothetical protein